MAWNEEKAREAVRGFVQTFPGTDVLVENYRDRRISELAEAQKRGQDSDPLIGIPYNRAVMTDGVHVYARLLQFDDLVEHQFSEAEPDQARVLNFLHTHYAACDRLVEEFGLQRVDFHGGRLHAVVLQPDEGKAPEAERIRTALAFASAFRSMVANSFVRDSPMYSDVVIGIDSGNAIAVNSGRKPEQEPLFVGSPANEAAHLANEDRAGIHMSDRVAQIATSLSATSDEFGFLTEQAQRSIVETYPNPTIRKRIADAVNEHQSTVAKGFGPSGTSFKFHFAEPPLRQIKFADLTPSNSIRVELAAVFADISGYTRFIDHAIETGKIGAAVHALHVIRKEFVRVLRDDFGGKKVRFVGDCLHSVIAVGSSSNIDARRTADASVMLAGGLRSSFEICREVLGSIDELGLSVGIEFGYTPLTRLGFRGDRSVRCSASKAATISEDLQIATDKNSIMVGAQLFNALSPGLKQRIGAARRPCDAHYVELSRFTDEPPESNTPASPAVVRSHAPR